MNSPNGSVFFAVAGFHLFENGIQGEEIGFPEFAVVLEPLVGFGEGLGRETARAALAVAAARDEAGTFENAKMFGDGGLAHGEGLCEFEDAGFATGETSENGAASGVGESSEDSVESVGSIGLRHCITHRLYNRIVI